MKKLNLTNLSANKINRTETEQIKGGKSCGCACAYAQQGGSSISGNCDANYNLGVSSTGQLQCFKDDEDPTIP